jgi:hypothetical protein
MDYVMVTDNILSYIRGKHSSQSFLIILNLGTEEETHDFSTDERKMGMVEVNTGNLESNMAVGGLIDLTNIHTKPGQGVVIKMLAATGGKIEL